MLSASQFVPSHIRACPTCGEIPDTGRDWRPCTVAELEFPERSPPSMEAPPSVDQLFVERQAYILAPVAAVVKKNNSFKVQVAGRTEPDFNGLVYWAP